MSKENIILHNNKLGIKTVFYNVENDVLGYAENDTIYLNDFYIDDLEMVNKHEVLHFYENSKQFRGIKKIAFELLGEEVDKLRFYYSIKYSGLYSEEEIENGILDNEIIIDMIIGNGNFPINLNDYIKDAYNVIVSESESVKVADKRYLNLVVPNKIKQQFMELTKWEKIFVANYYDNNKNHMMTMNKDSRYKIIRDTIIRELDNLYALVDNRDYFNINVDGEELIREYEMTIKSLISSGNIEKAEYMKINREDELKKLAKKFSDLQYMEYKHIVDLIKKTNYEPAFKYLMLNETLTKTYRQQKVGEDINNLVGKRVNGVTIKSHMNFNETVLGVIYNNLEDYSNFANLYFAGLSILNENIYVKNKVTLDGVDTFGKGKWIRFEGKKNSPSAYIRNAQALSSMVQDTPWCTKQQASLHLEEGDFYLFVDNDNRPHLGVKLIGDRIDEVRGVMNENAQEIEEEYRDVAIEFLVKNKDIKFGKEWLEKEEWNKRLIEYCRKIDNNTLTKEDMKNMIYDLTEVVDYKAHYAQCWNRKELLSRIKNMKSIKKLIAKKYGCNPKLVYIGDVGLDDINKNKFPYEVVLGNVGLDSCRREIDFSSLRVVLGDFNLRNIESKTLNNLEFVSGSMCISGSKISRMDSLVTIGEIADFYDTEVGSMDSLENIGGTANFMLANIGSVRKLKTIGEDGRFEHAKIGNMSGIRNIYGNVILHGARISELGDFECSGKITGILMKDDDEPLCRRRPNRR